MTSDHQDFNLDDLERMAEEGKSFLGDDALLDRIEKESLSKIDERLNLDNPFTKYWKSLLFLALACCLGLLLFNNFNQVKSAHENIYIAQYQAPPFLLDETQRSNLDNLTKLNSIKQLYTQEKYNQCLELINLELQVAEFNLDLKVYKGICQLKTKDIQGAIQSLSLPVNELDDLRQWNLCMALLANEQRTDAKKLLQILVSTPGFYNKVKAEEYLKQLVNLD